MKEEDGHYPNKIKEFSDWRQCTCIYPIGTEIKAPKEDPISEASFRVNLLLGWMDGWMDGLCDFPTKW